ncbi:MAG: GH116 family glycosyl-hydrolase [candidate division KSB1 bacterium]|nr:GH116 family glycosyl-hydrolase [candidate division KSB1 bacterium]
MKKTAIFYMFFPMLLFITAESCLSVSYSGDSLRHLHIPVGGIGTGNVLLGGRGNIRELQFFNTPQRDELPPVMTFFALRAQKRGESTVLRICERRLFNDFPNPFGVPRQSLSGCPRFAETVCSGTFPVTNFCFRDAKVPIHVNLTAYNPFIPLNVKHSSLPAAVFKWTLVNPSDQPVKISLCFNLGNVLKHQNRRADRPNYPVINRVVETDQYSGVHMRTQIDSTRPGYGEIMMFTTEEQTDLQTRWYRGSWWDNAHLFWSDFRDDGRLVPRHDAAPNKSRNPDVASLLVHRTLKPGETCMIPFILTWYVPYRMPEASMSFGNPEAERPIRNHYADRFKNARAVADYMIEHEHNLFKKTRAFQEALYSSSLPETVIDALTASMVPLKTHMLTRSSEGHVHAFEGLGNDFGSCPGNCTHVWNYAQTMAFLFPQLERNMRETAFEYATFKNGYQCFRTPFPVGNYYFKNVAADGQMGNIMRVYRDWKYCGDDDWLRALWPQVKAVWNLPGRV